MRKLTLTFTLLIAVITSNSLFANEFLSAYSTIHVPGDNTAVFGSSWDPNGADNEMTLIADYTWRWVRRISSATSVEYKFAMNGSWDISRGLGSASGPNLPQDNSTLIQNGDNIFANLPAATCVWEYYENTETSKLYVIPADLNTDGNVDSRSPAPVMEDSAYSLTAAAKKPLASYFPSPDDWRCQVIYQIITDRFDNGDPSNDNAHPRGKVAPAGKNAIHGGDFRGVEKRLPYLESLGVTAIWISPILLNSHGQYHGYSTFDFGRIDPHWGTLQDLRSLIDAAHGRGIRVFLDVICNHLSNLIEPNSPEPVAWKAPPQTYKLRWRQPSLRYPHPFDNLDLFHAHGPIDWNAPQSVILGELYNLDDFKTELPQVREYLTQAFKNLITATDCDGFRVDTTKHVEPEFWLHWCRQAKAHAASLGKKNFLIFGESWEYDNTKLNIYLVDANGEQIYESLLDFPGMKVMLDVFAKNAAGTTALKSAHERALRELAPHAHDRMARFIDNHDGKRFLSVAAENQPDVGKRHGRLKLALTYLLTSGGVPIIYYGTEQGFEGGSKDWDSSREDMFDGEFEFGPSEGDNFNLETELFRFTQKLLRTRAGYKALQLGDMKWLATSSDEPGVLAYLRSEGHSGVLIVINTSEVKSDEFSSPELFDSTDGTSLRPAEGWLTQWPDRSKPLRLSPQEIAIFEVQLRIPEIPKSVAGFSIINDYELAPGHKAESF
ncbi:MAG: hypothetical protein KKE40_07650 [Planctomycetes bacterium]|nr:hypothetical protein [Planctomycetota bacterium]